MAAYIRQAERVENMKKCKWYIALVLVFGLVSFISGCGSNTTDNKELSQNQDITKEGASTNIPAKPITEEPKYTVSTAPVTLNFFYTGISEEYFNTYIASNIATKLPHITINAIREGTGTTPQDLIAARTIPDIMYMATPKILPMKDLGLLTDLTPLIKKLNIDMSRFEESPINSMKKYSEQGELLFFPWGIGNYALYYNKSIFDKFAVDYPKDGITWDEVYVLAKTLTRVDGGVQYRGFDYAPANLLGANQLSIPIVNEQHKAVVNNDEWKKLFQAFGRFNFIAGNETAGQGQENNDFLKTQTLAMRAGTTMFQLLMDLEKDGNSFDFDVVTFPVFPEAPSTSLQLVISGFSISPQSKYQDQAMQIIELMMSDDVQRQGAEIIRLTHLKNPEVRGATGKQYPALNEKNINALYVNKVAEARVITKYDELVKPLLVQQYLEFAKGKIDLNTALREAEQAINKKIEEEKAAGR